MKLDLDLRAIWRLDSWQRIIPKPPGVGRNLYFHKIIYIYLEFGRGSKQGRTVTYTLFSEALQLMLGRLTAS